ncbi:trichohyalin-like isoform X2 [Amphibalanus amphitrite]|uniref:trichohyalin-like isoform X2 n=1 Tax=Amphibalanus amphitrite TaxID=1232801 RepID=UPI001C9127A0|nr:trichohyalin-like isoform X2 [Amphibalanus amphitrite]
MSFARHERPRSGQQQTSRQLPRMCNYYNRGGGCTRANCEELHLCTYFLQNRCIAERCNKAHTLETPRNKRLLDGLGWKGIGDMEMALDILRRRDRAQAVSICFNYNMGICPSTECDRLHVCYRHVMDKQCSPDDCDLSHDLAHGYHNAVLLARAGLNDTPETEILRQMQEQVRRYPPQPMLCYHHKEHCLRLHYCEAFLHSRCRFGDRCYKGHSLKEPHNRRVLKFFGWTEEHVLEALRNDRVGGSASRPARAQTSTDRDNDRERSHRHDSCEGSQGLSVETRTKRADRAKVNTTREDDILHSSNKQPKRHYKVHEQATRVHPKGREDSGSSQQMEAERKQWEAERQQWEAERQQMEAERKQWEAERQQMEAERKQWEAERQQMEAERKQWEVERQQWEAERQQMEAERKQWEAERQQWERKETEWKEKERDWREKERDWKEKERELEERELALKEEERELEKKKRALKEKEREVEEKERNLEKKEREWENKEDERRNMEADWRRKENEWTEKEIKTLQEKQQWQRKETEWDEKETEWKNKEVEWKEKEADWRRKEKEWTDQEPKITREPQQRERETYETEEKTGEEADDKHRLRTSKRKTRNLSDQSVNKKKKKDQGH